MSADNAQVFEKVLDKKNTKRDGSCQMDMRDLDRKR